MRIEFVGPIEQINPENDNVDVFLHLDDGRTSSFVLATPNNIYWCMENEGRDNFFGVPPVFVKRITPDSVERALKGIVDSGEQTLNTYGTLSSDVKNPVPLKLGKDEALILFELLVDLFDEPAVIVKDNADRMALSRLGGLLEKTLVEPFMAEYEDIAAEARKRLIEAWGTSE